jgi:cellulose synthase/poly-beta-1,6-N-acetylglucosamine synthase-like glycosyltransferase
MMIDHLHQGIEQAFNVAMHATFLLSWIYCAMTVAALVLRRIHPAREEVPSTGQCPKVTVQIPTFNELAALNCATCCLEFDYPADKLQILVGDDSNRPEISRAIDDFIRQFPRVEVCRRGNNHGFKPGNLNHMLKESTGDYILVLDSDFLPGKDFLRRLVAPVVQNPSLAGVQASWRVANARQNYSTLMGTGIVNVIHVVILPLLKHAAKAGMFCGSAELVRKDLLVQSGGWTLGSLTEDVDYSLRVMAEGERILFLEDLTCSCETPYTPKDLFRQQMRWAYGVMRALMTHGGRLLISRPARKRTKAAVICFCGGYLMVALMLLTSVLGLLNIATAWFAGPAIAAGLAGGMGGSLLNFLLTCGMLVSSVCAGFVTGFGARSAQKLVMASLSIGFILLFFVGKGLAKALLGMPMHWFMLKKNGNERPLAPVVAN